MNDFGNIKETICADCLERRQSPEDALRVLDVLCLDGETPNSWEGACSHCGKVKCVVAIKKGQIPLPHKP